MTDDEKRSRTHAAAEREEVVVRGHDPRRDDEHPRAVVSRATWQSQPATRGDLEALERRMSQDIRNVMAPIIAAWDRAEAYRREREARERDDKAERESDKHRIVSEIDEAIVSRLAQLKEVVAIHAVDAARDEQKKSRDLTHAVETRKDRTSLLAALVPVILALITLYATTCSSHGASAVHVERLAMPPDRRGRS